MFDREIPDRVFAARVAKDLNLKYINLVSSILSFNEEKYPALNGLGISVREIGSDCEITVHGYTVRTKLVHKFDTEKGGFYGVVKFLLVDDNSLVTDLICHAQFDRFGNFKGDKYFIGAGIYGATVPDQQDGLNVMFGIVSAIHENCCSRSIANG